MNDATAVVAACREDHDTIPPAVTVVPQKQCRDCGDSKPVTEFYAARGMRDGRSNTCKLCAAQLALEAKRHGHTIEMRKAAYQRTGMCAQCEGMSWRRAKPACLVCNKPYASESTGSMRAAVLGRRRFGGGALADPRCLYSADGHELWLGDSLNPDHVAAIMGDRKADLLCLDAPYSAKTHSGHHNGKVTADCAGNWAANAKPSGKAKNPENFAAKVAYAQRLASEYGKADRRDIDYDAWSMQDVEAFCALWCPRVSGWCVSITDDHLAPIWAGEFDAHDLYRFAPLPLVETGSRVRMTGDGPSNWTCWIVVARPKTREFSSWGTLCGAYVQPGERDLQQGIKERVVGGKPIYAMTRIVDDYSRKGGLIVDPTCGAGTTCQAARMTGRRSIGIDTSEERLEIAIRRIRKAREQRGLFSEFGS